MSDDHTASEDASTSTSPRPTSAKLFLGGLSWDTTEEKLRDHFGKYGTIVEAVVMRDRQTGRPRGFGFVTFTSPASADAVVEDIHIIDGRQIDAKKSVPQELKPKARKVFVGGLSPETTEDQFRDYFSKFGEVVEAQIMQDHMSGRSRGFGFVTFAEDASAENVFAAGTMHDLGGKKVEVKPATPKGSGSLARPAASGTVGRSGGSGSTGGSAAGSGTGGGAGRQLPPFGGSGGPAMFGGQPSPYGGYGMYGFPPPGMMAAPGAFGMQYGSMAGMGGMPAAGMPNPYLMMQQMGGYPPGAAAFGFPSGMAGPTFAPQAPGGGGGRSQGTPFGQQQHSQSQQQGGFTRPARGVANRNGSSRNGGKVDSASSLEQDVLPQPQAVPPVTASAVQEQLGKVALAE